MGSDEALVEREIFQLMRQWVQARSLRWVANEVGMSPSGLKECLERGRAYSVTMEKFVRFLRRRESPPMFTIEPAAARAALELLTRHLRPTERGAAQKGVVRSLMDISQRSGSAPPEWAAEILRDARQ